MNGSPLPDSPINALRGLAEAGNQQSRDLIDRYAELENLTRDHGMPGGVANLRAEFQPQFASMANLIMTLAKVTMRPQDFDVDLGELSRMTALSYEHLQEQLTARIRVLNMSMIREAQVDAAYISNSSDLK